MKHAYLILAHSNEYVLKKLLSSIDDERNDIYVHIDLKSSIDLLSIKKSVSKSRIFIFKEKPIYWGHTSMIDVELFLYSKAVSTMEYSYYHLLSGVDLPLKTQDEIHSFFSRHQGLEFIGFSQAMIDIEKVNKIHLFPKNLRVKENEYSNRLKRKIRTIFIQLQRLCNYNRHKNIEFKFGAIWTSLTHPLVLDLIKERDTFLKLYRYSSCVDEIYKHTFVYNSKYREKVYDINNELNSCLRMIDWYRGDPYTFTIDDFNLLKNSKYFFARKFDQNIDRDIIDKLCDNLESK